MMALGQIRDLAERVAKDVHFHSTEIGKVSDEVKLLQGSASDACADSLLALIGNVVLVNEQLQGRLAAAEEKLRIQAEEVATYQSAASTDALTGLPNRRAFDDELSRRLAEWQRMRTPFSLMLVDVDHFKALNDEHGHLTGDYILRRLSDVLAKTVREMDVPCRYGGEEFAVVLPRTSLENARSAAERLRQAIETMRFTHANRPLKITASIGMTCVSPLDDRVSVLRRADQALYAAKEAGRNRSYLHDGKACQPIVTYDLSQSRGLNRSGPRQLPQPELLSELPQQKHFENALTKRVAESHQYGLPLSVMFIAVDGVAQVAEEHGHEMADLVLDDMALRLQRTLRETDMFCRHEGERFAVIMANSTAVEAEQVVKRLMTSDSGIMLRVGGVKTLVTLRIGLASCEAGDDVESLCRRAEIGTGCDQEVAAV